MKPQYRIEPELKEKPSAGIGAFPKRVSLRDWPEDFSLENGNYYNICGPCGEQFRGHKRRTVCKCCETYLKRTKTDRKGKS